MRFAKKALHTFLTWEKLLKHCARNGINKAFLVYLLFEGVVFGVNPTKRYSFKWKIHTHLSNCLTVKNFKAALIILLYFV